MRDEDEVRQWLSCFPGLLLDHNMCRRVDTAATALDDDIVPRCWSLWHEAANSANDSLMRLLCEVAAARHVPFKLLPDAHGNSALSIAIKKRCKRFVMEQLLARVGHESKREEYNGLNTHAKLETAPTLHAVRGATSRLVASVIVCSFRTGLSNSKS